MAKYSEYIKLQDFLPVYDIQSEGKKNIWQSFIPTRQFCDLLRHAMTSFTSQEPSKRKSIWVRGTFGTGKSHASSVIKHLLFDHLTEIEGYLEKIEDANLREQVRSFRQNNRYFPVVLKGVEGAYDIPRMTLSIQKATKEALRAAGYEDMVVKSDFDSAINWINNNNTIIEQIISEEEDLSMVANNKDSLVKLIESENMDAFMRLSNTLTQRSIYLNSDSISNWLVETEHLIIEKGIADGLIVFWDEFTSVMDTIKGDRINVLQNIAEKSKDNNVFLYLISHRTETQGNDNRSKDLSKVSDRFDDIRYEMDEISTYLIMRHTFGRQDNVSENNYTKFQYSGTSKLNELLDYLCKNNQEERRYMKDLYPIHPYAAYLCSKLSGFVGSANRSVLQFMNDEKHGFAHFIDVDGFMDQKQLLTAEWLWDFFYQKFDDDTMCAAFTSTYRNNINKVTPLGDDEVRVFKAILLLNALSNKFSGDQGESVVLLAPSEKNITLLFAEDRSENDIPEILDYFHNHQIITRDIFGDFKIAVSGIDPNLLEKQKKQCSYSYPDAESFLNFNLEEKNKLLNKFKVPTLDNGQGQLHRACELQIYSCETAEPMLRSKLSRYMGQKPNYLHIALFLAKDEESRDMAENRIRSFSKEFPNSILILPYETLSTDYCNKFIDAIAAMNVLNSNGDNDKKVEYEKFAKKYITEWVLRMNGGTYTMYYGEVPLSEGTLDNVFDLINKKISPKIYPLGFEAIKEYRSGANDSFFKKGNNPSLVLNVLKAQTRDQLMKFTGQDVPAKHIFLNDGIFLVDETCNLTKDAQEENTWLAQICAKIDKCIDDAKKLYNDKFSLSDVLSPLLSKPYGFFPNKAFWVVVPYALRKYKNDLYDPKISSPVSDERLADIIKELFKQWDNGDSSSSLKTTLRFGSVIEKRVKDQLVEIFDLKAIVNPNDIKSYDLAKYYVQQFLKEKAQYPLWTILYSENITESNADIVKVLISMFDYDGRPTEDKFKEAFTAIHTNEINLSILLLNSNNYAKGFRNFVSNMEDEGVTIKDEWFDELLQVMGFVGTNKEVAFIKEVDAKNRIMRFYIEKNKQTQVTTKTDDNPTPPVTVVTPSPTPIIDINKQQTAKDRIKLTNMPGMMWQKLVLDLIEAHPEVSGFINDYLKE